MEDTFSIWQMVFMALLFIGAIASVFYSKRTQNPLYIHVAICLLGLILMIAFPGIWLFLCTLALTGGACLLYQGQNRNSLKKTVIGAALLILGAVFFVLVRQWQSPNEDSLQNLKKYNLVQYEKLGTFAKEKYSGSMVAVIVPPEMSEQQKELLKAFEKGLGASVMVVEETQFDPQAFREENAGLQQEKYESKLKEEMAKCSLGALLNSSALAEAEVVLMMTSLPAKKEEIIPFIKDLKDSGKILLIPEGSAKTAAKWLQKSIQEGQIGALVLLNTDSNINDKVPEDVNKAFEARYVLVTSENIEAMVNDNKYKVMLVDDEAESSSDGNDAGKTY